MKVYQLILIVLFLLNISPSLSFAVSFGDELPGRAAIRSQSVSLEYTLAPLARYIELLIRTTVVCA